MLDDDGDAVPRPLERRVGDEERVVALLPRAVLVLHHARAALALGNPPYLHASGLAGHGERRFLDARAVGGALGVVHDLEHALADDIEVRRRDSHRGEGLALPRNRLPIADDLSQDARLDRNAAVRDARHHHRELERCCEQVALADADDERLTALPGLADLGELPLACRHQARFLPRQLDVELAAETEPLRHRGDPVDPDTLGELVEVDVARFREAFHHGDVPVAVAPPASESALPELESSGAIEAVMRADLAAFERSQRHDHLERRSRRILAGDRLVGEWEARMADQLAPLPLADAGGEQVGVVARHRRQRQNLAGMDIEDHGRAALLAEACRDVLLKPEVDGQHVVVARPAGPAAELADHAAIGVDLDLPGAGLAAERGLQHLLGAVLADAEVREREQRIARQLRFIDGARRSRRCGPCRARRSRGGAGRRRSSRRADRAR